MTTKKNGVSELKKEEMAHVSGGSSGDMRPAEFDNILVEPHCKGCGKKISSYGGAYKCITKGCKFEGKAQLAKELDWL